MSVTVRFLIENGADVNAANQQRQTALHIACSSQVLLLVRLLPALSVLSACPPL